MTARHLPELWTWRPVPPGVELPRELVVRRMIRPRHTFEHPGSLDHALAEADAYADSCISRLQSAGGRPGELVLCLQHFADHPGEEIYPAHLFPYWAVVGRRLAERLLAFAQTPDGEWPWAIVLHSEDQDGPSEAARRQRDELLEIALARQLRHWFPAERVLSGYGLRFAPSVRRSVTSYGGPEHLAANRAAAGLQPVVGSSPLYWVPGAHFVRRAAKVAQPWSMTTALDVAGYLWQAVLDEAVAVALWTDGGLMHTQAAWRENVRALELMVRMARDPVAVSNAHNAALVESVIKMGRA